MPSLRADAPSKAWGKSPTSSPTAASPDPPRRPPTPRACARSLVEFDAWLPRFLPQIAPEDLVIITADHGNDPTWRGTDHTREEVPLIVLHGNQARPLGTRRTFADVAATLAEAFDLRDFGTSGESFLRKLWAV